MAHKQIKLNENDFKNLIKEAVKKAVKAKLNEGFADREMDEKWIDAERQLGSENMLQEVYNYFDGDQLMDFLRSIDQDYDMGLFEDDYDEEDYGTESAPSDDIRLLKPRQIKEFLDEYVIGQEDAKKALIQFGYGRERQSGKGDDVDVVST